MGQFKKKKSVRKGTIEALGSETASFFSLNFIFSMWQHKINKVASMSSLLNFSGF
jgi:hypothetical protein